MSLSLEFVEGLITIVITAILVPLVFRFIDDRRANQKRKFDDLNAQNSKEFDAALLRQNKVIEAQVQFLEKLSDLLWAYQLNAIDVLYYGQYDLGNQYQQQVKVYQDTSGTLLGKIRAEISKSLRLASHDTYEVLKELYYYKLLDLDRKLTILTKAIEHNNQVRTAEWESLLEYAVNNLSQEVDEVTNCLAVEFGVKGDTFKSLSPPSNSDG